MNQEKAKYFQETILDTFPGALVEVSEGLESLMHNHPGDRHVLAAAVAVRRNLDENIAAIITANTKHFPEEALKPWNLVAQHPDDFLSYLCDLHGENVLYELIQEQAAGCKKSPLTELDILEKLEKEQPQFAQRMLSYGAVGS